MLGRKGGFSKYPKKAPPGDLIQVPLPFMPLIGVSSIKLKNLGCLKLDHRVRTERKGERVQKAEGEEGVWVSTVKEGVLSSGAPRTLKTGPVCVLCIPSKIQFFFFFSEGEKIPTNSPGGSHEV